jgi:hypothetical protein
LRLPAKLAITLGSVALAVAGASCGFNATIKVNDHGYAPRGTILTDQCDSAYWQNTGTKDHTGTSRPGGHFFDTGQIAPGSSSSTIEFPVAGTFPFFDRDHTAASGHVEVPLFVTPSAARGETITIQWSGHGDCGSTVPSGDHVDVQIKRPESTKYVTLFHDQTSDAASFVVKRKGIYKFRSRLVINGPPQIASNWSTPASCKVS